MSVKLISTQGSEYDLSLSFEEESCVIGRDPEQSQLIIHDPKVSRKHAKIHKEDGHFILSVLSETNPTLVNDKALESSHTLKPGDKVQIGDSLFHFFDENAPQSPIIAPSLDAQEDQENQEEDEDNPYETIFEEFSEMEDDTDINFTETHRFLLKVLTGPNTGAEFPLEEGKSYTIGTDTHDCDIIFHDLSVSKKHATLNLSNDHILTLQDLGSSNGTLVDGEAISGQQSVKPNQLLSLGTSTFTVIDHDNDSQTFISPNLQAPVAVKEKPVELSELAPSSGTAKAQKPEEDEPLIPKEKKRSSYTFMLVVGILIFFTLLNVSISLFQTEEITRREVDYQREIQEATVNFPKVETSFRQKTGELFLQGHVIDSVEESQLLYQLQALKFIHSIEGYVIVDEAIAKEHNEIFSKKPEWRGVSIQTPSPGRFVISGYLQSSSQAEELAEYINRRFEFVELLDNQVAVEELLMMEVKNKLSEEIARFQNIIVSLASGDVKLEGMIKSRDKKALDKLIGEIKELNGVRKVNNFVVEVRETEALINLSSQYNVSGYSKHDNVNLNIIINGRILSKGDTLDGMTIINILPHTILLEKDGIKYKIDYKK